MLASNRMYARRHLAQGSAGSAGCAGMQAQRQQRPNCVRNAMAYYDDDDCRKEMHFRIEPSRHHRRAALLRGGGGGSTERGKAAVQEYTL